VNRTWQRRRVVWTKDLIAFARVDQDILVDKIPLTEIVLVRNMAANAQNVLARRKSSFPRRGSVNHAGHHSQSTHGLAEAGNEKSFISPASAGKTGVESQGSLSEQPQRHKFSLTGPVPAEALSSSFNNSEEISAALEGRGYVNTLQIQTIPDGFNSGRTYYMRAATESMCWSIVDELSEVSQRAKKRAQTRTRIMKLQKKTKRFYDSLAFQGFIGFFITMVSAR
jgi:hypothetical protein